jgi:hypothetical protein
MLVFLNVTSNCILLMQESLGYTYVLRMNLQVHGYTVVALHLKVSNLRTEDLTLDLAVVSMGKIR